MESRAVAPLGAALAVTVNGEALLPVPVELPPGVSAVRLPYRFANAGAYLLEASLHFEPGAPPAPGSVAAAITVTPPLRVLVVSERAQPVVALALAKRGMEVEVTAPDGLAARVGPRISSATAASRAPPSSACSPSSSGPSARSRRSASRSPSTS